MESARSRVQLRRWIRASEGKFENCLVDLFATTSSFSQHFAGRLSPHICSVLVNQIRRPSLPFLFNDKYVELSRIESSYGDETTYSSSSRRTVNSES